jgi:hypothetical protein
MEADSDFFKMHESDSVAREVAVDPYNKGGLAFWFVRAERYELAKGMPYKSVTDHRKKYNLLAYKG